MNSSQYGCYFLGMRWILNIVAIIVLLCATPHAKAAFVITRASVATCDTPAAQAVPVHNRPTIMRMHGDRDIHGAATGALIAALLGVATAVGFFIILPVAVGGAIALALATILLGAASLLLVDIDDQGKKPHVFAKATSLILAMLELMPILLPASIIFLVYDLFRLHKKRKPHLFRSK